MKQSMPAKAWAITVGRSTAERRNSFIGFVGSRLSQFSKANFVVNHYRKKLLRRIVLDLELSHTHCNNRLDTFICMHHDLCLPICQREIEVESCPL